MRAQVAKWGNSLGIRIPKACADEVGLCEGATVEVKVSGLTLVVAPAQRQYELEELANGIKPKNRHAQTNWGAPVGKEVW